MCHFHEEGRGRIEIEDDELADLEGDDEPDLQESDGERPAEAGAPEVLADGGD